MKKSRFSDEQIAHALRQAEAGTPVAEITPQTRYLGSHVLRLEEKIRQSGHRGVRELRQLRDENARLKKVVADLTLDKTMLQDVISKKW
jgi:putative transposase